MPISARGAEQRDRALFVAWLRGERDAGRAFSAGVRPLVAEDGNRPVAVSALFTAGRVEPTLGAIAFAPGLADRDRVEAVTELVRAAARIIVAAGGRFGVADRVTEPAMMKLAGQLGMEVRVVGERGGAPAEWRIRCDCRALLGGAP